MDTGRGNFEMIDEEQAKKIRDAFEATPEQAKACTQQAFGLSQKAAEMVAASKGVLSDAQNVFQIGEQVTVKGSLFKVSSIGKTWLTLDLLPQ